MAISVLGYLASRPGEVLSRDEIEEAIWKGRVVGYDSLTGLMFKLRKALGDDAREAQIIETIPKRGYRLVVAPAPVLPAETARPRDGLPGSGVFRGRPLVAVIAIAAVIAILGAAYGVFAPMLTRSDAPIEAPARRALVVLPFDRIGASDPHSYLAAGLTDDLTTALAMNGQLLVISRDSAFLYAGRDVSREQIAAQLNVDHLLQGSVRSDGETVRINVRLVEAASGRNVWAETFQGGPDDVFGFEEAIVHAVTGELADPHMPAGPQRELVVRTSSARAYKAFQLGRQLFHLYLNKAANMRARGLFEEALSQDPDFAMARAMLAWTYVFDTVNGWTDDRETALATAEREANRAISTDPDIPLAYFITGLVFRERGEFVKAMVEAEKAIALDPNYANAHVFLATLLYYAGRPVESIERLKTAMRLNPHHPFNYFFHLGQAYFVLRQYDEAIEALKAGLESNPASERLHVWLAASYANAGQQDDAAWEVEQVLSLNPGFSLRAIADAFPFKEEKDEANFMAGLRKAGFS